MPNEKKCFIIMPITTPKDYIEIYKGDADHFKHVLQHLFNPALEHAGFIPIPPIATGAEIIHAEIIKNLSECDLVLCDMSILNPNVFFELGIRTALDKPVVAVRDDITAKTPFDIDIVNRHQYSSTLYSWNTEEEIIKLTDHIKISFKKSEGRNAIWKFFGIQQTGSLKPEDANISAKVDLLIHESQLTRQEVSKINDQLTIKPGTYPTLSGLAAAFQDNDDETVVRKPWRGGLGELLDLDKEKIFRTPPKKD